MNANLLARRVELCKRMVKGFSIHAVATELTKNHPLFMDVSISAVIKDWVRRKKWMHLVIRPDDDTILDETIGSIREVAAASWLEYARATNSNAKVGALRTVLEANGKLVDIMQSIGAITKTPLEISTVGPTDAEVWSRLTDDEKRELIAAAEVITAIRSKKQS